MLIDINRFRNSEFDIQYMALVYYPTHTRMGAWLVGVLLGYILHNHRGGRANIPKVVSPTKAELYP